MARFQAYEGHGKRLSGLGGKVICKSLTPLMAIVTTSSITRLLKYSYFIVL